MGLLKKEETKMVKTDNPAGRLYDILNRAKNFPPNKKVIDVWTEVLNADSDSPEDQITCLFKLRNLFDETIALLESIEGLNLDLYLQEIPDLKNMVDFDSIFHQWSEKKNLITPTALKEIAFCAEELSRHHKDPAINKEELEDLVEDVQDLITDLRSSSLPDEVRLPILDQLEIIRRAIIQYELRGSKGLEEAFKNVAIFASYHKSELKSLQDSDQKEKKNRSGSLLNILNKLCQILQILPKVKELAASFIKLLPGGETTEA